MDTLPKKRPSGPLGKKPNPNAYFDMIREAKKKYQPKAYAKSEAVKKAREEYRDSPENRENIEQILADWTPYGVYHYGKKAISDWSNLDSKPEYEWHKTGKWSDGSDMSTWDKATEHVGEYYDHYGEPIWNTAFSALWGVPLVKKGVDLTKRGYQGVKGLFQGPLSPQYNSSGTLRRLGEPIANAIQKGLRTEKTAAGKNKTSNDFRGAAEAEAKAKKIELDLIEEGTDKRVAHILSKLDQRNPNLKWKSMDEKKRITNDIMDIKPESIKNISPHEGIGTIWSPNLKGRLNILYNKVGDDWLPGTVLNPQGKFQ